ncbi:hypothetical protein FQN60_000500 [Etheostoma spectabile]|uniref:Ras-GEF domain-containing protein n=1 Tax=Etheostoma spectabile TaxID=54343 RepID=A0A5J5D012_9PERO|nr:hypothetical protein FQN60_000500 [Etheostoma spectabile]
MQRFPYRYVVDTSCYTGGLNLAPVNRLRSSWEKLPSKYEKLFVDLQDVFDPSRNMAKYRNVLSSQSMQPPIIPLFPVVKKDLTFLHEGNDSNVDGLVNFEKLRMIAKEIRHVVRLTSANMDPALMFRQRKKRWKSLGQGSTNSNMLDVQGGAHKKRVRRSSLLNAKKLYEDAQMARKVKQYLSNLAVEIDEEKHQIMSLQCEPAYSTLSKNLGERRSTKSDMSPVSLRSALPSGKTQNRVSQVLQVQVPLNPLRKKSTAKDIGPPNSHSPQVVKKPPVNSSEEWSTKRPSDDTVSTISSLHSSPTVSPQGSPRKVGGVAKSQNSSQMNLSGSSLSLTSDASTKAGTNSLRSYGIGGVHLHKRILLMTGQHSRENSRERQSQTEEEEKEERRSDGEKGKEVMTQEYTEEVQRGKFPSRQRRGRTRQENNQGAQADAGLMLLRVRAGSPTQTWTGTHGVHPMVHTGSPPSLHRLEPMTLSPVSQPQLLQPRPPESPIRTRLMSPFRILRERSQSRERLMAVRSHLSGGEGTGEDVPSSPQDERQGQAEQRAKRAVSPNPFLWLCRDRRTQRKTV